MVISDNLSLILEAQSVIVKDQDSICQNATKLILVNDLSISISRKVHYEPTNAFRNGDQIEKSITPVLPIKMCTTIIYPLCITVKLEPLIYNKDLSIYRIKILVEVQTIKINISKILLDECAEVLKIWIESVKQTKKLYDLIYNDKIFENKNSEKFSMEPNIKNLTGILDKIAFQVKRKKILQNILKCENYNFEFNESDLKEFLDHENEFLEFRHFLQDTDAESLCLIIKKILSNKGKFGQQPKNFLMNYLDVRDYHRELQSLMREIKQMNDEFVSSQIRTHIQNESNKSSEHELSIIFKSQHIEFSLENICCMTFDNIEATFIDNNEAANFYFKTPSSTLRMTEAKFPPTINTII